MLIDAGVLHLLDLLEDALLHLLHLRVERSLVDIDDGAALLLDGSALDVDQRVQPHVLIELPELPLRLRSALEL